MLLSACKQPTANTVLGADDNGGYASDISRIQLFTDDAISLADMAGNFYNPTYLSLSCATVTTDTFSNPHRLQVVFSGSEDCVCLDGRKRRGSLSVSYSGRYVDTGSINIHSIQFSNYFVDDYQVSGTIQFIRVDTNVIGDWYYQVYVNDTVTVSPGQYEVWKGTLVRKWVTGYTMDPRANEVFSISGNATLTRPDLHVFSCAITTPLQVALNWNFIESGRITVAGVDGQRSLDYGNGTQDNLAELIIGINTYGITLTY